MNLINLKRILILSLISLSGISLVGCSKTYHSSPKSMRGYYISSYKKNNLATPIMFHITKHNASSMFIPYNRRKIAYRAVRNQELQLYSNGLQDAESKPNYKNTKHILQDRNMLKSISKNFSNNTSIKSKHFKVLIANLQGKKDIHITNVKWLHHRYYIKGHMSSPHYFIIHKKIVRKNYKAHSYTVNKFKFNRHHQLGIVIQEPQQHMHVHLFLLHRLSNHEAHTYLNRGQLKS